MENNSYSQNAQVLFGESQDGADVILRTCDYVDFYVRKSILSSASPFFCDMFSLLQPPATTRDAASNESDASPEFPIIDMTEDGFTLNYLLRLCYPNVHSGLTSLVGVGGIMEAATKYDMDGVLADIRLLLRERLQWEPGRAYAIACRFHLDEIAREAAEAQKKSSDWLNRDVSTTPSARGEYDSPWEESLPGLSYSDDIALLSAGAYYRFLRFVRSSSRALLSLSPPQREPNQKKDRGSLVLLTKQAMDLSQADLILQSKEGVNLYANRTIISFASPDLASLVSQHLASNDGTSATTSSLPVVPLPEDCHTLSLILQSIHPSFNYKFDLPTSSVRLLPGAHSNSARDLEIEFEELISFINASMKYSIEGSITYGKRLLTLPLFLSKFPLRIFFIAAKSGWKDEARQAAIYCSRKTFISEQYVSEMEGVSASCYHSLLRFQWEYQRVVCGYVKDDPQLAWAMWRKAGTILVEEGAPLDGPFSPEVLFVYMVDSLVHEGSSPGIAGGLSGKLGRLHGLAIEVTRRLHKVEIELSRV